MQTVPIEKFYEVQMLLGKEKQKVAACEIENKIQKETIDGLLSIQYTLADNGVKLDKALQEIKEIVSGTYEALDSKALQEIRQIITKAEEE